MHSLGCFSGTSLPLLEYGVGAGRKMGQEIQVVQATSLDGVEDGSSLFSSCGGPKSSSMAVVPYPGEELKESEPLVVHPLAIIQEHGLPESMSSDWVVQRVKNLCHMVGLSCEGFEDQMIVLFNVIDASRYQKGSVSSTNIYSDF